MYILYVLQIFFYTVYIIFLCRKAQIVA